MLLVLAVKNIWQQHQEKKADVKKSLTVYIVGALILFAGGRIIKI